MNRPARIPDRDDTSPGAAAQRFSAATLVPRGLCRAEAAAYVGVSPSLFDAMVKDGRMPGPKRINSRCVWDRRRVDLAFEALPDEDGPNPWDEAGE
jgi:hypothetical protein